MGLTFQTALKALYRILVWAVLCKRKTDTIRPWKGFIPPRISHSVMVTTRDSFVTPLISNSMTTTAGGDLISPLALAAHYTADETMCPFWCNVASSTGDKNSQGSLLTLLIITSFTLLLLIESPPEQRSLPSSKGKLFFREAFGRRTVFSPRRYVRAFAAPNVVLDPCAHQAFYQHLSFLPMHIVMTAHGQIKPGDWIFYIWSMSGLHLDICCASDKSTIRRIPMLSQIEILGNLQYKLRTHGVLGSSWTGCGDGGEIECFECFGKK